MRLVIHALLGLPLYVSAILLCVCANLLCFYTWLDLNFVYRVLFVNTDMNKAVFSVLVDYPLAIFSVLLDFSLAIFSVLVEYSSAVCFVHAVKKL